MEINEQKKKDMTSMKEFETVCVFHFISNFLLYFLFCFGFSFFVFFADPTVIKKNSVNFQVLNFQLWFGHFFQATVFISILS